MIAVGDTVWVTVLWVVLGVVIRARLYCVQVSASCGFLTARGKMRFRVS
ncbi:MAG: hypothetical protein K6T77_01540 [candidate division WOR-3 bacterium]|nr:hypothetical protein [candidate division WOR-3 bacterium]MCR4424206.1 hypothetical protein [candidate division WOR-3 bacterium]